MPLLVPIFSTINYLIFPNTINSNKVVYFAERQVKDGKDWHAACVAKEYHSRPRQNKYVQDISPLFFNPYDAFFFFKSTAYLKATPSKCEFDD